MLYAYINEPVIISPNKNAVIRFGFQVNLENFEAHITASAESPPKTGIGAKTFHFSGMRELSGLFMNFSEDEVVVNNGQPVATMAFVEYAPACLQYV